MLSALGVHRFLTKKVLTLGKLSEELIVQIISICKHHNGWAVQRFLQQMSIENHRQGFSAALCMPEYTAFSVSFSSMLGRLYRLIDCEILMVSGQYLKLLQSLIGEADKVLYNVQQAFTGKDTLKESIKLCVLSIFITSVFGFPLHEAVLAGSNRSCF